MTILQAVLPCERLDAIVCVRRGGLIDEQFTQRYPTADLMRMDTQFDMFRALRRGDCNVAATQLGTFEVFQRTSAVNGDCRLNWQGRVVSVLPRYVHTTSL